jgi:type I restriction enzyme S subunit
MKRLKYVANRSEVKVEADEDNPLLYIGLEHVESWTGRLLPLDEELVPTGISNYFKSGDTLFGKLRPYLAKACNVEFDGLCSSELLVLRGNNYEPRFLLYQLLSQDFINLVDSSTYGSKMPRASWDFIGSCELPQPPLAEQQTITDFLDAQTAKIDTLLAKKRLFIAKLKEKRSALIARTVTRGLPPAAAQAAGLEPHPAMKDSGVEWLGIIPAHWKFAQLRRYIMFITSGSRGWAEHYSDSGAVFVRIGNLTRDSLSVDLSDIQYVEPPAGAEGERTRIIAGDLLFSITAYLGSIAVAPEELSGAFVSQHIALVRLAADTFVPRYAGYYVVSDAGQSQLNEQGYGGTKIQLSLGDVKALWFPIPPINEQQAIAAYLDRETARIDQLAAKVEAAIERLTEYRQALITSAVTGKIDVRSLSPTLSPRGEGVRMAAL